MHRRFHRPLAALVGTVTVVAALLVAPGTAQAAAGSISGRVTDTAGVPIADALVTASTGTGTGARTTTAADGSYTFASLPAAGYRVTFFRGGYVRQTWGQPDTQLPGDEVDLRAGGGRTGIDAELFAPAYVRVDALVGGSAPVFGSSVAVLAQRRDPGTGTWAPGEWQNTAAAQDLVPGEYRLTVDLIGPINTPLSDRRVLTLEVAEEGEQLVRQVELVPAPPHTVRVTGTDRFGTSVAMSQRGFPDGADVAYVVNGLNFPDALAAGPAAAEEGGPVLLATPASVPADVEAELRRLDPERIVILGGRPSISDAVALRLGAIAPVTRRTGTNRYETSRVVALEVFGPGSGSAFDGDVFVVNGNAFPDGIAAGAAAAHVHAPVLLVDGQAATLDAATAAALEQLGAERVWVLGGANAVTGGIEADLRAIDGLEVERLTGTDRFGTSEAVTARFFELHRADAHDAVFASGLNFPDALAGAALAAIDGSPLMLVPQHCLTLGALTQAQRPEVRDAVFLGGPTMILPPVERSLPSCVVV